MNSIIKAIILLAMALAMAAPLYLVGKTQWSDSIRAKVAERRRARGQHMNQEPGRFSEGSKGRNNAISGGHGIGLPPMADDNQESNNQESEEHKQDRGDGGGHGQYNAQGQNNAHGADQGAMHGSVREHGPNADFHETASKGGMDGRRRTPPPKPADFSWKAVQKDVPKFLWQFGISFLAAAGCALLYRRMHKGATKA